MELGVDVEVTFHIYIPFQPNTRGDGFQCPLRLRATSATTTKKSPLVRELYVRINQT